MSETMPQPRIVSTPGTCGGLPRLEGHRLTVNWYAQIRARRYKATAHEHIRQGWPYLTDAQLECLSDYYESQGVTSA